MRRGTVLVGSKTRERRGHEPIPLRWGRDPLLSSRARMRRRATFVGGVRRWRGAWRCGLASQEADAERGAVDWPARRPTVGPASPPGAQRMRKAGASEIQSPADIPGAQAEGHGGVPRVCGSRGLKPRAGRPLPEVCLGRWAVLARRPWPGGGWEALGPSQRPRLLRWSLVKRALAFSE